MSPPNKPVPPTFDLLKKQIQSAIAAEEQEIARKTANMAASERAQRQQASALEADLQKHSKDHQKVEELKTAHDALVSKNKQALSELDAELKDLEKAKSELLEQLKGIPDGTSD